MSIKLSKNTSRQAFIRMIVGSYIELAPKEAAFLARYLQEIGASEAAGGRWKSGQGMVELRFPAAISESLLRCFRKANLDPPIVTDEDILFVVRTFPDIVQSRFRK